MKPSPTQGLEIGSMQGSRGSNPYHEEISDRFFAMSKLGELQDLMNSLDLSNPFSRALKFLWDSWSEVLPADRTTHFVPERFISKDMSAAMLGACPVVFMGTNAWATKPYLAADSHVERTRIICNQIAKVRKTFPDKKIVCVIVPEKDYVLDSYFLTTRRFAAIDTAIDRIDGACRDQGIEFVYNEYLAPLKKFEGLDDFLYPDTHLPTSHYIQIFSKVLRKLGLDWQELSSDFQLVERDTYGDLLMKFGETNVSPTMAKFPKAKVEKLEMIAGTPTFADPIGQTWQSIVNSHPLKPGRVLILGDSHSSILAQGRLTYLFAAVFERCTFFWNPLGIREEPKPSDVDYVVIEMAQRFVL